MLVGAIQGIIFSLIVFFTKKFRTRSLFFLSALILCIAVNNLQYFFLDSRVLNFEKFFGIYYLPVATLTMVFYFFYVKFFLFPKAKITTWNKLLFLPFLIFFLLTLFYKIALAFGLLTDGIILFFSKLINIHEGFALLFSIFLLVLIFRRIIIFEKIHKNSPQNRINWLKNTSVISLVVTLLYGVSLYIDLFSGKSSSTFFYILWISQAFVIYWLGHVGIYKFGISEDQKSIRVLISTEKVAVSSSFKNEHITSFEKFIIEDKNYLNNDVTLENVADNLGLSKSYLSRMINAELNTSYTDYINSLRVEEAKLIIQNPESEKYTLIAIGLEVGFNSKSAFNNAFKKYSGITPSEFKKKFNRNKELKTI